MSNINVADNVLANPTFWFTILVVYILAFGWRFAERTAGWLFRPQDTMILVRWRAVLLLPAAAAPAPAAWPGH